MKAQSLLTTLLACSLAMALTPLPGRANPVPAPDPEFCTVMPQDTFQRPRVVGAPTAGGVTMVVTVLDGSGTPIPNAFVELLFHPGCTDFCLCLSAVLQGYTNAQGVIELTIALGGCCQQPEAAVLLAEGWPIRAYDTVTSPDLSSPTGSGDCLTNMVDFSIFGSSYGGTTGGCCDYSGDGATNVADLVFFGGTWGRSCAPAESGD